MVIMYHIIFLFTFCFVSRPQAIIRSSSVLPTFGSIQRRSNDNPVERVGRRSVYPGSPTMVRPLESIFLIDNLPRHLRKFMLCSHGDNPETFS